MGISRYLNLSFTEKQVRALVERIDCLSHGCPKDLPQVIALCRNKREYCPSLISEVKCQYRCIKTLVH
ncbi:hypothetical protein Y032_0277g1121 [Ancylostoma ceylanicum]|uniref:Uncharacterized protein n=1 Tax=Ancylostoma ceylanicum TaxID=53326 RepID=A0A016S7G7_9BILA|nr:hypothetical protein Y032_0277g1121 [Ancylostoma ceylanicum]